MALRKDLRVLVVDDMSVSRQILLQLLESIGITQVQTATDGIDALSNLASCPAEIVIVDLNMPGMDGLELLQLLRNDRRNQNIGFVMTNEDETDQKLDVAWAQGMDRFLPKPFDINRLITCLEAVAGRV
ncbi:MAG: response regulator [Paracoccaceae bacterium]